MKISRLLFAAISMLSCSLLLSGCGNKGSLRLPPRDDATSAVSTTKPAPDINSQTTASR